MRKTTTTAASLAWARSVLGRGSEFAFVAGLHLALLGVLAGMNLRPHATENLARLDVRIIETVPLPETVLVKPKPLPAKHTAQPLQPAPPAAATPPAPPMPVMTAAADATQAASSFTLAPQTKSTAVSNLPPAPAPAPVPALVAVTPARFDADYLHNPAPAYPRAARRYGDQGRVLLKVLVSAQGTASSVELEASSGHARLDEAAQETVRRWRFVPARRGAQTIDDWVLVPVVFRLDT